MTRAFPLLRPNLRKVIDTIDVFSNKAEKVERYGIDDAFTMAPSEEARLLNRADLLMALGNGEGARIGEPGFQDSGIRSHEVKSALGLS